MPLKQQPISSGGHESHGKKNVCFPLGKIQTHGSTSFIEQ